MIIFDLDGTLACPEHRRHFVDASKNPDYEYTNYVPPAIYNEFIHGTERMFLYPRWIDKKTGERFEPDYKSFFESCDKDRPIEPIKEVFISLLYEPYNRDVQIWSGRCESVRDKTIKWLDNEIFDNNESVEYINRILKMRPIGNTEPDEVLKERWLDETYEETKWGRKTSIDFIFDSHPESIKMWQRRGIFVFNCLQGDHEF